MSKKKRKSGGDYVPIHEREVVQYGGFEEYTSLDA
jgi:hypothetical protein